MARPTNRRDVTTRGTASPRAWGFIGLAVIVGVAVAAVVFLRPASSEPVAWAALGTEDVHALSFSRADTNHLYFGHHGGLLQSRDGGQSWVPTGLEGVDAMHIATGRDGRIQVAGHEVYVESHDGGTTWSTVPNDLPGLDIHAFAVDPGNDDRAWAFVVGHGLFSTEDAGRTWSLAHADNYGGLAAYRDGDEVVLMAVTSGGLASSRDGGTTWANLAYPGAPLTAPPATSADGRTVYAPTTAGLQRSTDRGATWEPTGFGGAALAVAVATDGVVAVVDDSTQFFRSSDAGATWPGLG